MNRKRILKIAFWVLGSFIGIILLTSLLLFANKDKLKMYAFNEANKYLNKPVQVGEISIDFWKTFPNVSLGFDDLLVYSKYGEIETKDTAIYLKSVRLQFNLVDFINKNYTVKKISGNHGIVHLTTLKDGSINYDFIKENEDTISSGPLSFHLNQILLKETQFIFDEQSSQQYYSGYFNKLVFSGNFSEQNYLLQASAKFNVDTVRVKTMTFLQNQTAISTISINIDRINNLFEIKDADLTVSKLPFSIRGKVDGEEIDFQISSKKLNLVEVTKNFNLQALNNVKKLKGKGDVDFNLSIKGMANSPDINADFKVKNGSLSNQDFAVKKINIEGNYIHSARQKKEKLTVPKIELEVLKESFVGKFELTNFNHPRVVGEANGKISLPAVQQFFHLFNLDDLQGSALLNGKFDFQLNKPTKDTKDFIIHYINATATVENISFKLPNDKRKFIVSKGSATIKDQQLAISELETNFGSSKVRFDGEVNHLFDYIYGKRNLLVDAQVNSPALVIEDLTSTEKIEEIDIVRSWLFPDNIDGNVLIDIKKLSSGKHDYTNILGELNFSKHVLNFPMIKGENAKALISGQLKITEKEPMLLEVETTLSSNNVNFTPLFKEWDNFDQTVITSKNITGKASISLYLKGPFDVFKKTVDKNKFKALAEIKISDGTLKDVASFKEITNSLSHSATRLLISKNKVNEFEKRLLNLKFDSFENMLSIENGVLTIPKMTIASNALNLTLSGTHSFENVIDYSFNFRFRDIKGTQQSEFGDIIDDGTGFRVFLRMGGTIDNPTFAWDKEAAKTAKEDRKQQTVKDFKRVLKEGFGINKKDTTIHGISNQHSEDVIIFDFNEDEFEEKFESKKEKKKAKKKSFWSTQQEEEKVDIEIEP